MKRPMYTPHSTVSPLFDERVDQEATVKNVKAWLYSDYLTLVDRADNSYLYAKGYRINQTNSSPSNNGNTTDERYTKHIDANNRLEVFNQWLKTFDDKTRKGFESRYIVGKQRKGVPVDYKKLKHLMLSLAPLKNLVILDEPCCKNREH